MSSGLAPRPGLGRAHAGARLRADRVFDAGGASAGSVGGRRGG